LNFRWYRISGLFLYAFQQKSVRTSSFFFILFAAIYWFISYNPFEIWQQNSKYDYWRNEITAMEKLPEDSNLLDKIIDGNLAFDKTKNYLPNKLLSYQIYNSSDFSLEYWTHSTFYLNSYTLGNINSISYREIEQDKFLLHKVLYKGKYIVFWYDLNRFIEEELNSSFRLFHNKNERKEYLIIGYKETNSKDFNDSQGNFLFSLKRVVHSNDLWIIIGLLVIMIAAFFYIRVLYFFAKPLTRIYPILGCIVFVGLVYSTRKLLLFYKLPSIFYTLKLFNPSLYSSDVTPSLGDLFLFVFSTQIILYYLQENLVLNLKKRENSISAFFIHTIALVFLLGESFSINKIFERMVVESSIWFNFDYFPRLTIYSFIGLGIMLMTFSNYYLLSNLILKTIYNFKLNNQKIILSFFVFLLSIILLLILGSFRLEVKLTFVLLLFFIALFYGRYYFNIRNRVYSFVVFLFFASFTTTFLLSRYNIKKEEVILSSIATNVTFGLDRGLESRIIQGLNKYNVDSLKSYLQDFKDIECDEIDKLEYQKWLDLNRNPSKELLVSNEKSKLFLIQSNSVRKYLIQQSSGEEQIQLMVYPKTYLSNIASSTKDAINDVIIRENKISHGLYINDTLHDQLGPYNYNKKYPVSRDVLRFTDELFGLDFEHFVFNFSDTIKVLVTTQKANPVSILTQFSYIFCINFLLSIFLFFLVWSLRITYISEPLFHFNELRSKIVLAIFLLVIGIFIGITLLSFNSLKNRFTNYNKEIAYNNLKVTQQAIEQIYNASFLNPADDFDFHFKKLKGITSIQYDLYNDEGKLIQSSYRSIGNMIYPRLLESKIFFGLKNNEFFNIEKVKQNETPSNEYYSVLKSKPGNRNYYLRLTSFDGNGSLNEEMRLIVVLINLYVLFFLISMVFAIWLANRITKPLQTLTEKISNLGLSRKNEYLEYQYKDEIGELVKRYNIMVDEIQESARLLAEQEREEAWSEMAKQIAHEIKNPLTPMKLKIQFLQRNMKEGASNLDQLVSSTAETLIEQINNLDNIATAFSNFGKLHSPHIEQLDWKLLIQNTVHVFQSRVCQVLFKSRLSSAMVECDRNQMISCLNNLVKNAIQAYDDEETIIDIALMDNERYFILEIKDYGKGIKEEERDKIFIPNFTTKSSGSGLGLAITKKILHSMNGLIWFDTELGQGTSFFISLPKMRAPTTALSALEQDWVSKEFVRLSEKEFYIDLEYSLPENVFSTILYQSFRGAYLNEIAYSKILRAKELLFEINKNYKLVIKDALRPFDVQRKMWDIYQGPNKENYIASPDSDSLHNYGMAVDVLIMEISDSPYIPNKLLDFGCEFDDFSEKAHWNYSGLTAIQRENRELLRNLMLKAGFISYEHEFWHFEAMYKDWVRENCIRV